MTYGVYNRDMKSTSLNKQCSIEVCKKYLRRDTDVVCSEKRHCSSWGINIMFHEWRGFHHWEFDKRWILGFVSFKTQCYYYTWADRIVYDPKMERGAEWK